jgi:cell division septum initiation protein DivIVA
MPGPTVEELQALLDTANATIETLQGEMNDANDTIADMQDQIDELSNTPTPATPKTVEYGDDSYKVECKSFRLPFEDFDRSVEELDTNSELLASLIEKKAGFLIKEES